MVSAVCDKMFESRPRWNGNGLLANQAIGALEMVDETIAAPQWQEKFPKKERPAAVTAEGRLCSACGERKPPEAFRRNVKTTDRRMWRCRECLKKAHRSWVERNREHVRDMGRGNMRKSRADNPSRTKEALRRYRLKRDYGLTPEQYLALIESHDRKCAVCKRAVVPVPAPVRAEGACIDHDHKTGRIRGILCHACNRAIGMLRDDVNILKSAVAYLGGG